ncbi:diguanylate cyclase domain-containing protein [Desulfocurvus sp. DL9XJH121]
MPVSAGFIDCASCVGAVMFFWLAAIGFTASGPVADRLPTSWLGWFGLLAGLACGLGPRPLILPDGMAPGALQILSYLLAALCLTEFWARSAPGKGPAQREVATFLFLGTLHVLVLGLHPREPERWTVALFSLFSCLLAARALFGRGGFLGDRRVLRMGAALCLGVSGAVWAASALPAQVLSALPLVGVATGAHGLALARAVLAGVLALLCWALFTSGLPASRVNRAVSVLWLPSLLALVLVVGGLLAGRAGSQEDARQWRELTRRASLVAAALDRELLQHLRFEARDQADPAFQALGRSLRAVMRLDTGLAHAAIYGITERGAVTGVVAAEPDSPRWQPPGSVFSGSLGRLDLDIFRNTGKPMMTGPYRGPYGSGATVHVPLLGDGVSRPVRAALTLDVRARDWLRMVQGARMEPLRMSLLASVFLLGFFSTLRVRRFQEDRIQVSERRYRSLFVSMQEGVVYCRITSGDRGRPEDFQVLDMNPAAEKLLGLSRDAVVGRTAMDLFAEYKDQMLKWIDYFGTVARTGRTRSREMYYLPRKQWLLVRGFSWERGSFAISMADITERRVSEQEHRRLALHDPLTELPNRRLFRDRLDQAIARADRTGTKCAVLYLDLNDFKMVNDTRGHAYGDLVLAEVARRLKSCMRRSDTLARIGGDEFVAVVPEFGGLDEIAVVADKIQQAMAEPFVFGGETAEVGVSIGVGVYPDHGDDAETVLVSADAAMYRGKGDRDRQFVLYEG